MNERNERKRERNNTICEQTFRCLYYYYTYYIYTHRRRLREIDT